MPKNSIGTIYFVWENIWSKIFGKRFFKKNGFSMGISEKSLGVVGNFLEKVFVFVFVKIVCLFVCLFLIILYAHVVVLGTF